MNYDSLQVVIADDDRITCNYFQVMLERMGHKVLATARNGKELVKACLQHHPDLVITDLNMPENDGIWSAEMLNEQCPCPVIMISAHHEPDMIDLTTADNIHAYLVKPVKPEDLEMAIALAMRKATRSRQATANHSL
jgi:AmiR/NasT family two-component response regulator